MSRLQVDEGDEETEDLEWSVYDRANDKMTWDVGGMNSQYCAGECEGDRLFLSEFDKYKSGGKKGQYRKTCRKCLAERE